MLKDKQQVVIENIIIGVMTFGVLTTVGFAIYAICRNGIVRYIFLALVAFFAVCYLLGVTVRFIDNFWAKHGEKWEMPPPTIQYPNETLTNLSRLECKYGYSTLDFMQFVEDGRVPGNIHNLDHITWIGLVREMSLISYTPPPKKAKKT